MQPIGPVNAHSLHASKAEVVSESAHPSIGEASAAESTSLASSTYHFRADSWLSQSDALLLLRKRARREAYQQNYVAAIQIFNQLSAYEPDNADNFANRGLMHYNLKHYDRAFADYNRAIELNPELDKAYSNRANLHATQQNWLDALDDYEDAIDINPLNIRARINQAITLREMGDYEEAVTCLDVAMFFRSGNANLYAERGRTYQLQGLWNCAMADYNRALEITQASIRAEATRSELEHVDHINRKVLRWMNSWD